MATFPEIYRLAFSLKPSDLAKGVQSLCQAAEENAHASIHEEKSDLPTNFYDFCLRSLSDLLAYCDDRDVVDWFNRHGVRF